MFPTPRPATAVLASAQFRGAAQSPRGVAVGDPRFDPEVNNAVRRIGFYAVLGLIFLRYSLMHEVLASVTGSNTFILYLFAIPAAITLLGSGGIRRTFVARPAKYWLAFVVWLLISVPFSTWKGESATYAITYLRTDLPMVFYAAGLAMTWKECRQMLATIGIAGITNIGVARLMTRDYGGGRIGLDFGMVSNPNDYAGHLLLIVPFILFLVIFPPKLMPLRWLTRLAGIAAIVVALWMILMTGSRGALIGLVVGAVFVLWKSSMQVRITAIVGLPLLAVLLFTNVSGPVRNRLASLTSGEVRDDDEAADSSKTRRFLLDESIQISFKHPLFGLGPGQFANVVGKTGGWHSTHNSFTQISSETGLPGFVFYMGAVISSFLLLQRTWKQVREQPELGEITVACYCISLSYVMFCTAIFFLNFAYFFYLPAATGLVISISRVAQRELAALRGQKQFALRPSTPIAASAVKPAPVAPVLSPRSRAVRFTGFR